MLGLIDAGLGRKEEALREGRRAVELLPVEKDATQRGDDDRRAWLESLLGLAINDLACEQLAVAIRHSERDQLWRIETDAVLGPAARRAML